MRNRVAVPWVIAALLIACRFTAPASAAVPDGTVIVPLIHRGAHLYVQARVGGRPSLFILDTGASANLVTPAAAKRLALKAEDGSAAVTGAGGKADRAGRVRLGTLNLGEAAMVSQSAYVIPLPEVLNCDGLLGTPFLRAWVVEIDYARQVMTLYRREGFTPSPGAIAVPIVFHNDIPFLRASLGGAAGEFGLDTGDGGAVTVFDPFVDANGLRERLKPAIRTITGRGIGGLTYGDLVRLPQVEIGPFHLSGVTAEISRQMEGAFARKEVAGNLGGEVWGRFTLTLDYAANRIFLAPNPRFSAPFVANRTGLGLDVVGGETVVRAVIPGGPAAEAGVHEGDIVLGINGASIDRIDGWKIRDIFRGVPGARVMLQLRASDGAQRDATLVLRDLI